MGIADQAWMDLGEQPEAPASANAFADTNEAADAKYGFPPGTMAAIAKVESNNNPKAVSPKGAQGIYQIMPATQKNPGFGLGRLDPNSPNDAGAYLAAMVKHAGGDLVKGIGHYNSGPGGNLTNRETANYINLVTANIPQPNPGGAAPQSNLGGAAPQVSPDPNSQMQATQPSAPSAFMAQALKDLGDGGEHSAPGGSIAAQAAPGPTGGSIPTGSFLHNVKEGAKYGVTSTLANVKQGIDMMAQGANNALSDSIVGKAVNYVGDELGLPTTQQASASTNQYMQNSDANNQALLNTAGGKVGNVVGSIAALAPTVFVPGANTLAGSALLGLGAGAAATRGDVDDRLRGAAGGAIGGAAGTLAGRAIGAGASKLGDYIATSQAANQASKATKDAVINMAGKYGMKITPTELSSGLGTKTLSGIAKPGTMGPAASTANQPIINNIVKQELGIPATDTISPEVLASIRKTAGEAYNEVRNSGTVQASETYNKAIDSIISNATGAAKSFPNLKNNEVENVLGTLKQPSFSASDAVDAIQSLRNMADKAYAGGDKGTGKAFKAASGALEDALAEHLQASGNPQALANFQAARQTIAKTYSVEKALNPATGDVSAIKLAAQMNKNKPLSGGIKDIAVIANTFPKDMQALKEPFHGSGYSPFMGLIGSISHGPVGAAAGAIPYVQNAVRGAMLSDLGQKGLKLSGKMSITPNLVKNVVVPAAQTDSAITLSRLAGTEIGKD